MFYDCGSLGNYSYIFDTEDNSCELVDKSRLQGVHVEELFDRGSIQPAKLKMLYSFKGVNLVSSMYNICIYNIGVSTINLNVRLVDLRGKNVEYQSEDYCNEMTDFCYDGYMLFLMLTHGTFNETGNLVSFPLYRRLIIGAFMYIGIPIPAQMLYYMDRFVKSHDFESLDRIFGGFLFSNFHKKIGDFEWRV